MVPPPRWPPLCTLPPGPGPPRFVCYCEGEGGGPGEHGGFNLCVTDAAELWSTCFTPDRLAALEDRASLTLSGGPSALELDLSKVPGPEAASRLQALTLDLAERVCSLEQRLAGLHSCFPPPSCCSRGDGHQPQKERLAGGASSLLTRPRSSERWPWTWGQEAVSRGVSHQPRLQEVLPRPPPLPCPGSSVDPARPSTPCSVIPSSLPVRSQQVV
ncbi:protein PAXX isoform X4 [Cervus elaphus]|uniref:protein PAXX isoform X4 n=1 Tax=Cervus canadensis TaxID=1574408 RepID=UPI001C9E91A6|nr:protein PAXX isoform X4 [Cervus canadensis]XP_043772204.1 protein PAXX isoform X4 [Cervus elaphus]